MFDLKNVAQIEEYANFSPVSLDKILISEVCKANGMKQSTFKEEVAEMAAYVYAGSAKSSKVRTSTAWLIATKELHDMKLNMSEVIDILRDKDVVELMAEKRATAEEARV
jgi:hypothetical protein